MYCLVIRTSNAISILRSMAFALIMIPHNLLESSANGLSTHQHTISRLLSTIQTSYSLILRLVLLDSRRLKSLQVVMWLCEFLCPFKHALPIIRSASMITSLCSSVSNYKHGCTPSSISLLLTMSIILTPCVHQSRWKSNSDISTTSQNIPLTVYHHPQSLHRFIVSFIIPRQASFTAR